MYIPALLCVVTRLLRRKASCRLTETGCEKVSSLPGGLPDWLQPQVVLKHSPVAQSR